MRRGHSARRRFRRNLKQTETMDTYNATIPAPEARQMNARNYGGRKETTERHVLVVLVDGELREAVDLRLYMGRSRSASTHYASVWVRPCDGSEHLSGTGKAGGYGYCRASGAASVAFDSAGIRVTVTRDGEDVPASLHGAGMRAIERAMHAIADAAGYAEHRVRRIV